jgi:hypothetical protein
MSKSVANVVIATDTFEGWIVKTNILLDTLSNEIVTVSANAVGALTTGNATVNGTMSVTTLAAGSALRGGTVTTANTLNVTSNVTNQGVSTFNANLVVNSVANVYMTATSTTIRGGGLAITSNTTISAAAVDITTAGQLVISAAGGLDITGSLGDVTAGTVNATSFVGVGQGFSNMNAITSNTTFTVPTGVYKLKYTLTGGGGGGGSSAKTGSANNRYSAAGGGGGATAIGIVPVSPGQELVVVIGLGGTGGVGTNTNDAAPTSNATAGASSTITFPNTATIVAGGGAAGFDAYSSAEGGLVAAGGTATGGTINIAGGPGSGGNVVEMAYQYATQSTGGATIWGAGPQTNTVSRTAVGVNGSNGVNYGTGGSGALAANEKRDGGNGAPGILLIEY